MHSIIGLLHLCAYLLRQLTDHVEAKKELTELMDVEWLRENAIHAAVHGLDDEFFFDKAGDGNDLRLELSLKASLEPYLSNLPGCLVPIHDRHIAIHEDEPIPLRVVLLNGRLDPGDRLLAIIALIVPLFVVRKT